MTGSCAAAYLFEARPSLKPPAFRAAGIVQSAAFCATPLLPKRRRTTAAQKYGKKYEGRVLSFLATRFDNIRSGPWIRFATERDSYRLCQPDALLVGSKSAEITIVEVKVRHTLDAYWQLRYLYAPVVKAIFPSHKIRLLEIVKSFDGGIHYPETFNFHFQFDDWQKQLPDFGVVQWKP